MSRRLEFLLAGAALALVAGVGVTASAQPQGKASDKVVRIERDGDGSNVTIERDGKVMIVRSDHHEDLTAHLRAVLQLRPNQEAALAAYVQALKPKDQEMMVRMGDEAAPTTTPERLAQMEKMLAEHDSMMRAHIAATRAFYDQLDPAQKKAFDELGLASDHMAMMRQVRFVGAMPPMPPMPPMRPDRPPPPPPPGF